MTPLKASSELDKILEILVRKTQSYTVAYLNGVVAPGTAVPKKEAKQAIEALIQTAITEARLNEAFLIGVQYEMGRYSPAAYLVNRKAELQALTTTKGDNL